MPAAQDSIDSVRIAARAADSVKATDIVAIDVSGPVGITDAFLIASGSSDRQVVAIAEEIEKQLHLRKGMDAREREGFDSGEWVLLDYGDFVAHIMLEDKREFYDIERLWKDCPDIDLKLEHPEQGRRDPVEDEPAPSAIGETVR
ncbi:ribosome silencing factor [Bifidobacterium sp. 82T24]|uniref:ribosome silencing factor n=1 Tax=Bifidobacterium pluvialisilvae TaxID=2834436 RepID=UPI001C56795B|nr:ribosome silencing factor [Bifidobacterium pluvialisilvae]MBW3087803.1 ribosome silencing factor [Bifidobacterium pluvialisilvae]